MKKLITCLVLMCGCAPSPPPPHSTKSSLDSSQTWGTREVKVVTDEEGYRWAVIHETRNVFSVSPLPKLKDEEGKLAP